VFFFTNVPNVLVLFHVLISRKKEPGLILFKIPDCKLGDSKIPEPRNLHEVQETLDLHAKCKNFRVLDTHLRHYRVYLRGQQSAPGGNSRDFILRERSRVTQLRGRIVDFFFLLVLSTIRSPLSSRKEHEFACENGEGDGEGR